MGKVFYLFFFFLQQQGSEVPVTSESVDLFMPEWLMSKSNSLLDGKPIDPEANAEAQSSQNSQR